VPRQGLWSELGGESKARDADLWEEAPLDVSRSERRPKAPPTRRRVSGQHGVANADSASRHCDGLVSAKRSWVARHTQGGRLSAGTGRGNWK